MRKLVWTVLFVATATVGLAGAAMGQIVRGTVVDSATQLPIRGASVLLRERELTLATAVTDSLGNFSLRAPREGTFTLLVRRFGFQPRTFPGAFISAATPIPLRVEMAAAVTTLDTVRVTDERSTLFTLTPGQAWFTRHLREGKGMFFSGLDILHTNRSACDYFANLPGVEYSKTEYVYGILCRGGNIITSKHPTRCLGAQVDRVWTIAGLDSADLYVRPKRISSPDDTISLVIPFEMVKGIEVYLNRSELPKDFSIPQEIQGLVSPGPYFGPKGMRGTTSTIDCVWIQVWTEIAW